MPIKAAKTTAAPTTFGRLLGEDADLRNVEEGKWRMRRVMAMFCNPKKTFSP